MFVSLAKKYDKPNALNEVFMSRAKSIDANDYLVLITLYLQVFNPSRASGAEKLWIKHKVRGVSPNSLQWSVSLLILFCCPSIISGTRRDDVC